MRIRFEDVLVGDFRICLNTGHTRLAPETPFDRLRKFERLYAHEVAAIA